MKLLLLFGHMAVGKMTVGQEFAKITELRLFHNHMTIEPVLEVFGEFRWDTIERLRHIFFEDFAASGKYGMIFTFMWGFDQQSEWEYVERITNTFKMHNADIYYVELVAPKEIRLQRNTSENRLKHKASMRNTENSSRVLISSTGRYISNEGEIPFENYLKIDNTDVPPEMAAKHIKERFSL